MPKQAIAQEPRAREDLAAQRERNVFSTSRKVTELTVREFSSVAASAHGLLYDALNLGASSHKGWNAQSCSKRPPTIADGIPSQAPNQHTDQPEKAGFIIIYIHHGWY